jgi:non-specific protein-tyrosine kinase
MAGHTALRFIRRWLPLLLLGPLLGGIIGYAVIRQIPSVYEATVTLLVGQGSASSATATDQLLGADQLAQTYAEAVRTRPVLSEAASQVGLSVSVRELLDRVHARRVPNTQLLRISAENTDPAIAANLANTVAQVFVSKNQALQTARFSSSRDSLGQLVDALQADLTSKTRQMDDMRAEPASAERDAQLAVLQSQLTQLQALHSESLRSYEDLRVVEARGMNTLTVIEPAAAPEDPIRPNRSLVTLLAVLGGLILAAGAAAAAEFLDDALRDRQRVALATGLVTLGLVPRGEAGTNLRDPATRRLAEGYRLLRSNILASIPDQHKLRTLMIASPAVGEGKSTTAANLAIVLAESGRRVILVDADMHRPSQMKLFGVSGRNGVSTLLLDSTASAAAMLRSTWLPNLSVLPAGVTPADPSLLLSSKRVDDLLAQLHELADLVVIDTPPLLAQPDAALLATRADGVLLVVDATKSRGRQAARAVEMLHESGAVVLGVVLNRIPKKAMDYTAYDSYYAAPPDESGSPPGDSNAGDRERGHVVSPKPMVAASGSALISAE